MHGDQLLWCIEIGKNRTIGVFDGKRMKCEREREECAQRKRECLSFLRNQQARFLEQIVINIPLAFGFKFQGAFTFPNE